MSLAAPEESSVDTAFVCNKSESVLSVIEKCLDNGLGSCLVVGDDHRFIGRISLDDIRRALADGTAIVDPTLGWHPAGNMIAANPLRNDVDEQETLRPVVDSTGHLTGVLIDRSTRPIQVAMPHMTSDDFRSVLDAFISGWISSKGPYVNKFEEDFSRFVGVRHGVAVSNGTVALHLALVALGIGPGDEVIVPDLTFAATINAVLYCGATPVIVDVDRQTWCMSRDTVKRACTAQTKAIIPVHLYGRPAEIGPITDFARGRGIAVVEDCAEAHGARYRGKAVGQFGDVSCFSFYANKIVTTGEGGMCVTDSPELAALAAHVARPRHVAGPLLLARAGRLQLPHHQPAGGDRPVADLARQRSAAAQRPHRRPLPRGTEGHSRACGSRRRCPTSTDPSCG